MEGDDDLAACMRVLEDELIKLNQAADLVEMLYVDGMPAEYVVDGMVAHSRRLRVVFYKMWALLKEG